MWSTRVSSGLTRTAPSRSREKATRLDGNQKRTTTSRPRPRRSRASKAGLRPAPAWTLPSANRVGAERTDRWTAEELSPGIPGYTLFAPKHHTLIYLIDNQGRAVHSWKSQYEPGQSVYLLENGHLLHCCFTRNRGFTRGGEGGRLR